MFSAAIEVRASRIASGVAEMAPHRIIEHTVFATLHRPNASGG